MRVACLAIGLLWTVWAAAETLYRLPWAEGLAFTFTQVPGGRITSHFTKATLNAVDIAMPPGIGVLAARRGVVEALEAHHGASGEEEPVSYEGNFVRVRHADHTAATYAHLLYRSVTVTLGQTVEAGQLLGYSGSTGDVTAPHLHFVVSRTETNSAGWREDVSLPVTFYVGVPPVAFAPRAALSVTADYSSRVDAPRAVSDGPRVPLKHPVLGQDEVLGGWALLAVWLACGAAGLICFWRFSRS
jgi:murein DD-endopeptidase MepM/ murein hydrolase activator NlpD